ITARRYCGPPSSQRRFPLRSRRRIGDAAHLAGAADLVGGAAARRRPSRRRKPQRVVPVAQVGGLTPQEAATSTKAHHEAIASHLGHGSSWLVGLAAVGRLTVRPHRFRLASCAARIWRSPLPVTWLGSRRLARVLFHQYLQAWIE